MKRLLSTVILFAVLAVVGITPVYASEITCQAYLSSSPVEYNYDTDEEYLNLITYDSKGREVVYACTTPLVVDGIEYDDIYDAQDAISTGEYIEFILGSDGYVTSVSCIDYPSNLQANITVNNITYINKTISTDLTFNYLLQEAIVTLGIYDNECPLAK